MSNVIGLSANAIAGELVRLELLTWVRALRNQLARMRGARHD
jgi:hypothetical protein